MRIKLVYETEDGLTFEDAGLAAAHEKDIKFQNSIDTLKLELEDIKKILAVWQGIK